ncbi:acyltransferase family protein [Nocardioides sp. TF02-7]|uniref:acyltransferase family protein n=1 Tax=Nocardioides sp. TF02-7 TaxID=2917724 RepID=UPI001F06E7FB|nr:acyltransferase family protein [Nocardioides sp. TF02-7]UMG91444.1 acyltransferase [Nocardioides sp. TF02-7]
MVRPIQSSFSYHPELDGLRGFAMLAIVFFHAQAAGAGSMFIALDLFFVLSGFLVAHVVMAEVERTGRLDLGGFYSRRVRRLLPAAVVAILATSVVMLLTHAQTERLDFVRHAQAALVYLANWQMIADSTDYFAADVASSPFMHYWSLSVEEQYYILFPLVVLLCLKLAPRRRGVLLAVLAGVFVLSLASQVITAQVDPDRAYFATDTRVFQIVAGALAALAVRQFARGRDEQGNVDWRRAGPVLASVGAVGYLVLGTELISMSNSTRNIVATALATALVLGLFAAPRFVLTKVTSWSVPVHLGRISYGTYLYHWPIVILLTEYTTVRPSVVAVITICLATSIASLSYELLESPIRKAPRLHPYKWRTVAVGGAVSLLAALVVVNPVLGADRTPSVLLAADASDRAGQVAEQRALDDRLDRKVPDVDLEAVRADRGMRGHCTPDAPEDCLVVDGDGPHVVLVGDSHARMWTDAFAALAEDHGWRFSISAEASCIFQDGVTRKAGNDEACDEARDGFYDRTLPAMEPDLVVFASAARTEKRFHGVPVAADGVTNEDAKELLARTTRSTVDLVQRAGASVLFLKTSMGTEGWGPSGPDPLRCLAEAERLRDCTVVQPPDRPAEDAIYESLAIGDDRVAAIDPTPVYCPDAPVCLPVLGGKVVWRNVNHLTPEVLVARRDRLWRLVQETGLLR